MINYNRLGYEIRRDLTNLSTFFYKNFQRLKTPAAEICPPDALWHPYGK